MKKTRRKFKADFKAKVAIEAIKEQKTVAELCEKYSLHAGQISQWKRELLDSSPLVFDRDAGKQDTQKLEEEQDRLHAIIGRQQVELDFLKKSFKKLEG
jgi:transposase